MKAAKLVGTKEIVLEEIPIPEIADDEVLIEVKYCGICGTDLHGYATPAFFEFGTYLGHEFSGVITKVGSNVNNWQLGDRVTARPCYQCDVCWACRHGFQSCCERLMETIGAVTDVRMPGAFSKFVRVPDPDKRLYALPDTVSFEEGALVEPLACSLRAVRISAFRVGDYAMVLGTGPIGLGVIAFLKYAGAGLIIATETDKGRATLAKKFGADHVFCPTEVTDLKEEVMKLTGGLGVDQVFECSGATPAFKSATSFLRPRGQVVLVSVIQHEISLVPFDFQMYELQLQPSYCHSDEFPKVIDFLKKRAAPVKEMITSKIKLDDIVEQGFDKLLKPGHGEIKILVSPE